MQKKQKNIEFECLIAALEKQTKVDKTCVQIYLVLQNFKPNCKKLTP